MAQTDVETVLAVRPRPGFVDTPFVRNLAERSLTYIKAGFPVHFRGPSGSGKTTLAMHVAHQLGRPTMLICGDDEFGTSDLVGGQRGYRRRKVVDNFVHSVMKTEEDVAQQWIDNRLTTACREGLVLVYDEFTRSRAEANNVLLSILEEKVLVLPANRNGTNYLRVHPEFVAIFTSNPEDYAGVHKTQEALLDRMVTLNLDGFDLESEVEITRARSGISVDNAEQIVSLVRACREAGYCSTGPTVRSCIMIAKVMALRGGHCVCGNLVFEQTCLDVLARETRSQAGGQRSSAARDAVMDLIRRHCSESNSNVISLPLRA